MIEFGELQRRIVGLWRNVLRPRENEPIAEWARRNIVLNSDESGDFPGAYDPDLNPLPTILFEAYQSGKYKKLVFKKSSQSGVTLAVLVLLCWYVCHVCRNFLYVIDVREEARDISNFRFQPMIKSCPEARRLGRILTEEMTALACRFAGCIGYFRGANSIGGLANKSVGLAIFDETDTYKAKKDAKSKKENEQATELGKERGKRQTKFVQVFLSKPADWEGTINQEYLVGTQHKCYVPCPHCGTMQEIEWERIKFKHLETDSGGWRFKDFESEVYLECLSKECREGPEEGKIFEESKPGMIAGREWRQTNFGDAGEEEGDEASGRSELHEEVFSCEITDLYSTFPGITWGSIAREFVECRGNPTKLETFFRGRLARATKRKKVQVLSSDLDRMLGRYARGHVPFEPDVVLMASDYQQVPPVKKWVKAGFRLSDDACAVIDYGESLSFDELVREADEPVIVDRWNRFTPAEKRINPTTRVGLIDERHDPGSVRDFITSTYLGLDANGAPTYRFYSCRGWGGIHARRLRDVVTPTIGKPPNASHDNFPLWVYDLSDDHFKDLLYNVRIARFKERLAAAERGEPPPANVPLLTFPANVEPEFKSELCQERFEWDPHARRWGWIDPKAANDWGDAVKYLLVAWYLLRPVIAMEKAAALDRAA